MALMMPVPIRGRKARIPLESLFFRKVILGVFGKFIEHGLQCRVAGRALRNQGLSEPIDQIDQTLMLLVDVLNSGDEMLIPDEGLHGFFSLHVPGESISFATRSAESGARALCRASVTLSISTNILTDGIRLLIRYCFVIVGVS